MSTAAARVQQYLTTNKAFMLSMSWCPDCQYADGIWAKYGVADKVTVLELDKMEDQEAAKELQDAFFATVDRRWFPTIWFNGAKFGDEATLKELEKEGKTEEALKKAGLL